MPPSTVWWLQPLASATPYLFLVVLGSLLVFLVALRGLRSHVAYLAVAVIVLTALRFGPHLVTVGAQQFASRTPTPENQKLLDITSFNARNERAVWFFAWHRNVVGDLALAPENAPFVRSAYWRRPDFACLQEASNEVEVVWPQIAYDEEARLAVLPVSRYSLTEQRASLGAFAFDVSDSRRGNDDFFVRGVFQWHGRRIAIYSVQLRSFARKPWELLSASSSRSGSWVTTWTSLRNDYLWRENEARELRQRFADEELPFIVCGDLNSTPYNWSYRHVSQGLRSATSTLGIGRAATYPASFPLVAVDHILASDDWLPVSARVFDSGLSDHRVVEARLVFRAR